MDALALLSAFISLCSHLCEVVEVGEHVNVLAGHGRPPEDVIDEQRQHQTRTDQIPDAEAVRLAVVRVADLRLILHQIDDRAR